MNIYSWNINGLRAIHKKGFIDWISEEEPDILCLQETKIQEVQLTEDLRDIEGYKSYYSFAEKKGYSGVAIYSKIEPKSVQQGIGIERFDNEGRILIANYDAFTLINIYFPNGQMSEERLQYKMDFYDGVLDYCNELVKKGERLIICGDYNTAHKEIDLKNPKANSDRSGFLPIERQWMDKFIDNGYTDVYRNLYPKKIEYSWWSYRFNARANNAGWRIDYHFVSNNLLESIKDARILTEVEGSDHCPVVLELN